MDRQAQHKTLRKFLRDFCHTTSDVYNYAGDFVQTPASWKKDGRNLQESRLPEKSPTLSPIQRMNSRVVGQVPRFGF
jgi:hypothetical protein